MSQKKILIINPISLFPMVMASQDRVLRMAQRLSRDHLVSLAFPVRNRLEKEESAEKLGDISGRFFPIPALNPDHNKPKRGYYALQRLFFHHIFNYPVNYFYFSRKYYMKQFLEIMASDNYDIVQVEYWYMADILEKCGDRKTKVIDSHDILFLKQEQRFLSQAGPKLSISKKRYLNRYRELEISSLIKADLIIFITRSDLKILGEYLPENRHIVIETGQDFDSYKHFKTKTDSKTILFYGSMGSKSNISAFFDLWNNILPDIKKHIPRVKLMVVGAKPPESIKKLHDGETVIVTGFVKDVRPYLAQSSLFILPLDVAAGFRSRVVEVMAMGIPVIGSHKALDSFEMKNGVHGFITDNREEMAGHAVRLLNDSRLRKTFSDQCQLLAEERYSIEATYGKLSTYYSEI